jgi:dTDP-4-amino-4,6-dideoxygalactose transaminase
MCNEMTGPIFSDGPPNWPPFDEDVRAAVEAALADGTWGRYEGGNVARLSSALAEMHGVEFSIPCCSGTFAVDLALRALKVGTGDEVVLAGYDFSGNFRAVEAVGARPVLVDIEPATWCLDAESLEGAISGSVRAVIVSHLHGGLADMQAITEICRRQSICVVEDACQSPGAMVQGRIAGTWGDVGVLSFGGSKLLTAGRGGAILTAQAEIAQRAKVFCNRGNHAYPLSELQAAVLLPQLAKLSERNAVRYQMAERLRTVTRELAAVTPVQFDARGRASFYKFGWLYHAEKNGNRARAEIISALQAEGVAIDAGFRGFTLRSSARCRQPVPLPHSTAAAAQTLVLHHPILLEPVAELEKLATAMKKVLGETPGLAQ